MNSVKKKKKSKKIKRNEKLWQEILHHSFNLMMQYMADNQNKFDKSQNSYNFVKFECTSTYPRLTFVIKFLPILNGVSLIQIYTQNKLSRYNDSETSISHSKHYREMEIIYGSEIKNLQNIELRHNEPKKLKEIEKFFCEYYVSILNKFGLFYNTQHEPKYFENSLLLIIEGILTQNKNCSIDQILTKVDNKFLELFSSEDKKTQSGNTPMINGKEDANSDFENLDIDNFISISKNLFLREFYRTYMTRQYRPKETDMSIIRYEKDNTLMFSRVEDTEEKVQGEPDMSFDLARQISEIGFLDLDDGQTELNRGVTNVSMSIDIVETEKRDLIPEMEKIKFIKNSPGLVNKINNEPEENLAVTTLNKLHKSITGINRGPSNITASPIKKNLNRGISPARRVINRVGSEKNIKCEMNQLDISEINKKVTFPNQIEYPPLKDKLSNYYNSNKNLLETEYQLDCPKVILNQEVKTLGNENATFR